MRLSDGGLAGAIVCRPSTCALLHRHMSPGISPLALPRRSSARFTSILCSASPRPCLNVVSIHALEPDFYKIPYADGIPVGKRLKLWNLPPNCKHSELLEWITGVDVVVESLELTNDPALNAQGIGGFVEFATKQNACIAIVRLDGYKFRGHYIRMDFAEKRPRPNYSSRRSRPNQNSSSRGRPPAPDMVPSNGGTASSKTPSTPRYDAANAKPSSDLNSIPTAAGAGPQGSSSSVECIQHNPAYANAQSSPVYGGYKAANQSSAGHGSAHPSSVSGGSRSASLPNNLQEPISPPQSSVAISENNPDNMVTTPSSNTSFAPSYGSSLSAPIAGTTSRIAEPSGIHDSTGSSSSYSSQGTFQQAPSTNGIGSTPVERNSSIQTVVSVGDDGIKSSSVWAAPSYSNNPAFGSTQLPPSNPSTRASPGPGTSGPASNYGESRQADSGVQERSTPTGVVDHISSLIRPVQGYSPSSLYAGYGKIESYDDPFKGYGAPDKALVEPWSKKSSFRSGPMYGSPEPSSLNRLFVGNLALSVDDATLQQLFSRFGTVLEARVLRELESGRSRGFGVVAMSSVEGVKAAFEGLDGWHLESRPLKVEAVAFRH